MQLDDETGRAFPVWAEIYNVGEREWRRLLRGIGAVRRRKHWPCCSVQSYVVNSSLDHAAMVGSNRSGT